MQKTDHLVVRLQNRLSLESVDQKNWSRLAKLTRQVARHESESPLYPPVAFFNASTRIYRLSLNSAFHLLAAWGLRLQGVPVAHFVCNTGMSRCVLGTDRADFALHPPCQACHRLSRRMYAGARVNEFIYQAEPDLAWAVKELDFDALEAYECDGVPFGRLVLPSIRWVLRRHHLGDDEATRFLYREYILSAHNIAIEFERFLDEVNPLVVVVFNGMFFPEATARYIAQRRGLRVVTHEVGIRPFSAFFTDGEATAYPVDIPEGFELSPSQEERLAVYLEQRIQGNFSMAGIRFWPEMRHLDEEFLKKSTRFRQIVPIFTNVVFDTSQPHSNVVFSDMFAWLEEVLEVIRQHPETLFVVRAHPDEKRYGKESHESVSDWVLHRKAVELPNVVFIDSNEYLSSYELIRRSKFVMVYNSSIGLEASLMGAVVLCAGRARYTQYPTVYFPGSPSAYHERLEAFLGADRIDAPDDFQRNARRFLYFQLYRTSLPFDEYLEAHLHHGFVNLRRFDWQKLLPENSSTMRIIVDGLLHQQPFLLEGD